MQNEFNNNADPRPHHYILKLSLSAGVDRDVNPQDRGKPAFQQAILFLQRVRKFAESKGAQPGLKAETLPVTDDGYPRVRLTCPPGLMSEIKSLFARKIRDVNEIPLPKPPKQKSLWKRIFGL
ncbi:MAG: hypothetical protein EPN97_06710 [Alphaproteobacteria bacterium]|nr:MAG: hypothetical protein EPN97_06710 [Alphaproteobacteria bacterium]